ncbi:MAG: hypothetical protein GY935_20075 [Gammaproteobacteria bacterium]|nr:hypothetical protein [Gammaproteobacteria bacterium]
MRKLSILLISCLTVSCAMRYDPTYNYNYIQIANLTGATVTQVRLRVGESGRSLSCDRVSNNSLCDEHFGRRNYRRQVIDLNWIDGDGSPKSQQLRPRISSTYSFGSPLQIMVEISNDGTVKSYFHQVTSFRE